MKNTPKNMFIEELIKNVLENRFKNFDQASLDNAKACIIDIVGWLIGGSNAPGSLALIELIKE